jgi:RHS repeat-associated protein
VAQSWRSSNSGAFSSQQEICGSNYAYDADRIRLRQRGLLLRTDNRTNVVSSYGYDPLYELTSVHQGGNSVESYSFDPVGNRTGSLNVALYSYNSSNQLTSFPGTSYSYDGNGNLSSKTGTTGTTGYSWDFENRLAKVTLPGGSQVSFKYDPMGRRIQKTSASGTVNYLYDGANVLEEVDSSGSLVARYTQGLGIDSPLAMLRSGTTSYYEADGLGSITSLSNSSGALATTYTYDSFGNLTATSGTITNPYRYTGREYDPETGLYYYRARYYDPTIGRFLSEDPVGFYSGPNFYAYAWNSPVNYYDPSGLAPVPGQPPIPVPGGGDGNGWKWNPNPQNGRGGSWGPQTPIPGQGQPSASWDPEGHWDVDNGKGDRQRCDPNGKPITPEEAHGNSPSSDSGPSEQLSKAIKFATDVAEDLTEISIVAYGIWSGLVD